MHCVSAKDFFTMLTPPGKIVLLKLERSLIFLSEIFSNVEGELCEDYKPGSRKFRATIYACFGLDTLGVPLSCKIHKGGSNFDDVSFNGGRELIRESWRNPNTAK